MNHEVFRQYAGIDYGTFIEAEIIDNLRKVEGSFTTHESPHSFFKDFEARVRSYPLTKINFAVSIGNPAYGKTGALDEWLIRLATQLTEDVRTDLSGQRLEMEGFEIRLFMLSWVEMLKAAVKLELVPPLTYGEWTRKHLDEITNLGKRAVGIARFGAKDFPGIEGKCIGIIGMDLPAVTASRIERRKSRYSGENRAFELLRTLTWDKETRRNIFVLASIAGAEAIRRRLELRMRLPASVTPQGLERWFQSSDMLVDKDYLEALASYYPTSFATLFAATQIQWQQDKLILSLDRSGGMLTEEERELIARESRLFEGNHTLLSPSVLELQDRRALIIGTKLYTHIFRSLHLRAKQVFVGWNDDVDQVHFYPSLPIHFNLVKSIIDTDPSLLLP